MLHDFAPHNGMHPTANQQVFYRELAAHHVECAAGDAWREATIGYIRMLKRLAGKKRGTTALDLVIEPTENRDFGPCPCCGDLTRRVWGFLHRAGQTEAAYFVEWTIGNVAGHGAHVDLIIGRWGEGAERSDRFAVSLEYRYTETGPGFMVIDAGSREVSRSEVVGRSMSRLEVIGTPLAEQVFEMVDAIWLNDDRIEEVRAGAA